jgi:hypothetical protein
MGDPAPSRAAAARRALHRGRRRTDGGHHPEAADGERTAGRVYGPAPGGGVNTSVVVVHQQQAVNRFVGEQPCGCSVEVVYAP